MAQMPVGLLLVVALLTAAGALWTRRSSFGCQWEGAPSLLVITAAASAYLTSSHASIWVGGLIHALIGRWNYEDPLGHLCAIVCACTAVYMCLVRLADLEVVQAYYTQWVVLPVSVALALMQATWVMSPASESPRQRFEDVDGDLWLMGYWSVLCVTLIYLLALASRIVLRLRAIQSTPVLNMYLLTFGATMAFWLAMHFHVVSQYYIRDFARALGYACVICWSVTPAYSWWVKSRLRVPNTVPVDSGADRARGTPPFAAGDDD